MTVSTEVRRDARSSQEPIMPYVAFPGRGVTIALHEAWHQHDDTGGR